LHPTGHFYFPRAPIRVRRQISSTDPILPEPRIIICKLFANFLWPHEDFFNRRSLPLLPEP